MTRIIGAAAFLTIALAAYAASLHPYEVRTPSSGYSHQADSRDENHTASIR
ncbi:hypothetical protein [Rhizobium sp. AC44/96]|jgi:hypothetical protein|uniref:hypothetical protein n=1 Tax=Rhizobium sp. AC44/96 TaxID=1841654 RepID=UPI000B2F5605|nr:hypothetical protein [Rhizobium sp. AC44/96]